MNTNDQQIECFFRDSFNMRGFLTLISVKAGSLYYLLTKIKAENARKEVFMSEFSVNQQVWKKRRT